ncbi:heterocyst frequency control protein PatD [Cronbergia sp. UHCC 0137]|uniref:heterocyst frequency control protein PatD n=1 Tax=Cronbergia sp. UHCC 0137 TaxID=3110239 RepID=UPI002B1F3F08|nr:heterocyst frequency control protein PatD [Cronbergia sp. UHCC 0137]MEA5618338.1 heterocyst frequency control protein PatD [Cronbergia sp. UHCC 0137]
MSLNHEKYQALANLLTQLRADVTSNLLDVREIRQRLSLLQEFFVQEVVPLSELDSRELSYRTEISKQLRLLEVDVMFLQGAKQLATVQGRMRAIEERLGILMGYCGVVLGSD